MNVDIEKIVTLADTSQSIGFTIEQTYPLLFFSLFFKKSRSDQIIYLDVAEQQEESIKARLESTFLGSVSTYRLGGLHELSKPALQQWLQYITAYQGPNKIIFVVPQDIAEPYKKQASSILFVDIPLHLNKASFTSLFSRFVHNPSLTEKRYIEQLYARTDKIPLETACLLLYYVPVIGSDAQEFFAKWVDKLLVPEASLFLLSGHLLAGQTTQFLKMWSSMKDQYPEQFWLSYWSEQIWRALFYCRAMQERDIAGAKKIGYRLPFSFLQKDYRTCDIKLLQAAHSQLYDLDVRLKNGAGLLGLDLFFLRYLGA